MRCQSGVRTSERRGHRYSEGAVPVRGVGTRLALTSMGWLTVHEFVIRGFLSHQGTKTAWAMAFPRINCRTITATPLTATATVTLSLPFAPSPITSLPAADSFYFLKQPARASFVSSVQTYLTHLPSQGRQLRRGKSDVYQQPIACLSDESSWVKEDPWSRGQCVFSCVTLPSQDQPLVRWDEEVLDARGGHHLEVGAAQEEEGWRRRAL